MPEWLLQLPQKLLYFSVWVVAWKRWDAGGIVPRWVWKRLSLLPICLYNNYQVAEAGCVPPAPRLIFALFSESGTQSSDAWLNSIMWQIYCQSNQNLFSAGNSVQTLIQGRIIWVQPLDNYCTKFLGSTRTKLAESEAFAGLVSPAARLVQITT